MNIKLNKAFTIPENWWGGFYELALELGPSENNSFIYEVISFLWGQEKIVGPFDNNDIDIAKQNLIENPKPEERHYYGILNLSDTIILGCGTYVVKEENGSDWILLYVPGNMAFKYLGGKTRNSDLFKQDLEILLHFFQEIAVKIYRQCGFKLGLIGYEVSGELYADTLTEGDLKDFFAGILLPTNHKIAKKSLRTCLSEGLFWIPPNL